MSERKKCWQIDFLPISTPCFKKAGNVPCKTLGCLVDDKIQELKKNGVDITDDWIELLCHSRCRLSRLTQDNEEYLARLLQTVA